MSERLSPLLPSSKSWHQLRRGEEGMEEARRKKARRKEGRKRCEGFSSAPLNSRVFVMKRRPRER